VSFLHCHQRKGIAAVGGLAFRLPELKANIVDLLMVCIVDELRSVKPELVLSRINVADV
jgi:hypothetical protein